jgi:hypothetical protein
MAETTMKNHNNAELLDQMLEDLAGEEFSDYDDDFELSSDFEKLSITDEFADIDSYH